MDFFHKEAQAFSLKTGFHYDKESAEKMIEYAEARLPNHWLYKERNLKH